MQRISAREFEFWKAFYRLFPFDDLHRFHRPAAAISASAGGKIDSVLKWLAPEPEIELPPQAKSGRYSQADINTMNALLKLKG